MSESFEQADREQLMQLYLCQATLFSNEEAALGKRNGLLIAIQALLGSAVAAQLASPERAASSSSVAGFVVAVIGGGLAIAWYIVIQRSAFIEGEIHDNLNELEERLFPVALYNAGTYRPFTRLLTSFKKGSSLGWPPRTWASQIRLYKVWTAITGVFLFGWVMLLVWCGVGAYGKFRTDDLAVRPPALHSDAQGSTTTQRPGQARWPKSTR